MYMNVTPFLLVQHEMFTKQSPAVLDDVEAFDKTAFVSVCVCLAASTRFGRGF